MTLYPKSTEWSVCLLNLQSWVGFGGINCGKPGDSCRSLFIPKRWRSPATFEFGSRELFIQTKVTSRIARIRILHQAQTLNECGFCLPTWRPVGDAEPYNVFMVPGISVYDNPLVKCSNIRKVFWVCQKKITCQPARFLPSTSNSMEESSVRFFCLGFSNH